MGNGMAQRSHFAPPAPQLATRLRSAWRFKSSHPHCDLLCGLCARPEIRKRGVSGRAAIPKAAASRPGATSNGVCSDPPFEGQLGRRVRRRPVSGRACSPCVARRARDRIRIVGCAVVRDRRRTSPFRPRSARPLAASKRSPRATPGASRGGRLRSEWGRWRRVGALKSLEKAHHPTVPR